MKQMYDSVGVIPKNIGANQLWDFSADTMNSHIEVSTFTTVPSAPYGSTYSGSTFVESDGNGNYMFYKSSSTKLEIVGVHTPSARLNFSGGSDGTLYMWTVGMGYSKSDAFSGTAITATMTGTANGNIVVLGSGTGTLIIPGGTVFTNVLQVKSILTATGSFLFGAVTVTLRITEYSYYHNSEKFPILTVSYQNVSGATTSNTAKIKINKAAIVGIDELDMDASFTVFPNPAKDYFHVSLYNPGNATCTVEVMNTVGQSIQLATIGNGTEISEDISISNLSKGMYFVKTTLGDKVSIKKLIKE